MRKFSLENLQIVILASLCHYVNTKIYSIMKVNTLKLADPSFPARLKHFQGMPKTLYAIGNLDLLNSEITLSVVGARKVTAYGREVTTNFVTKITSRGVVIVSGLALGVDAIAHKSCLGFWWQNNRSYGGWS